MRSHFRGEEPKQCARQKLLFERFVNAVLPELVRDPDFAFPGQTDHPFFWLAPAERLQMLRSGNAADFLAQEAAPRFTTRHEAARAFFEAVFSPDRPDPLPHLNQKFDRFWMGVSPERWRLYSTWSYSMVRNTSALINQDGAGEQGPETMLCRAMIRYVERALGLTIEELETDGRRDGGGCGGDDSGFGWDAAPIGCRLAGAAPDYPGAPRPADQVMSLYTANLYFPTPYGPVKHFERLPDIVDSFFASDFLAEYVRLSSEHAVHQQASLRAKYTPGVRRALEDSWGQMSTGHRRAFIATALSRLYVRPDPVQLHNLPSFRAWCEGWNATPKLHEHCIRNPTPKPFLSILVIH